MQVCPTCGKRAKRSLNANKRYWQLIHLIAESIQPNGQQFSAESWHTYMKGKYLGMRDITIPSGQVITIPVSSADLDTAEFHTYMTEVEVWAAENGVYLPELVEA